MAAVGLSRQAKGLKMIVSEFVPSFFTNHLIIMETANELLGPCVFHLPYFYWAAIKATKVHCWWHHWRTHLNSLRLDSQTPNEISKDYLPFEDMFYVMYVINLLSTEGSIYRKRHLQSHRNDCFMPHLQVNIILNWLCTCCGSVLGTQSVWNVAHECCQVIFKHQHFCDFVVFYT